jgi:hypothetical protein
MGVSCPPCFGDVTSTCSPTTGRRMRSSDSATTVALSPRAKLLVSSWTRSAARSTWLGKTSRSGPRFGFEPVQPIAADSPSSKRSSMRCERAARSSRACGVEPWTPLRSIASAQVAPPRLGRLTLARVPLLLAPEPDLTLLMLAGADAKTVAVLSRLSRSARRRGSDPFSIFLIRTRSFSSHSDEHGTADTWIRGSLVPVPCWAHGARGEGKLVTSNAAIFGRRLVTE